MGRMLVSARMLVLIVIAAATMAAGLSLLFWDRSPIDWREAPTHELVLLLALLFLPLATVGCQVVERKNRAH